MSSFLCTCIQFIFNVFATVISPKDVLIETENWNFLMYGIMRETPIAIPIYGSTENFSHYTVEYRDGTKSKGDKIGMPCTHSTVIYIRHM